MKIIDAYWEKRNLGVDVAEFEINGDEPISEIKKSITENEKNYNYVKVPIEKMNLYNLMSELGYSFVEESFHLFHDLKTIPINSLHKRISDCVSSLPMDDSDIDELFSEIRKGMFRTDRIALHPDFGIEKANLRYINWIKDELDRGTEVYKLKYKNDNIGFFVYKEIDNGVYYPFLAGMYQKYINSGLGINIVIKPIQETIRRNGRCNFTYVSSNNTASLMSNIAFGYRICGTSAVFTKKLIRKSDDMYC